jgi:hypothetical protein
MYIVPVSNPSHHKVIANRHPDGLYAPLRKEELLNDNDVRRPPELLQRVLQVRVQRTVASSSAVTSAKSTTEGSPSPPPRRGSVATPRCLTPTSKEM